MDNQHQQIKGYRDLTHEEIDMINTVKQKAAEVGSMLSYMQTMPGLDQRWVAIAKTDLQKGFMFAVRAIAQPESF